MANKTVLIGTPRKDGAGEPAHEEWVTGDTPVDPDGNPLGAGAGSIVLLTNPTRVMDSGGTMYGGAVRTGVFNNSSSFSVDIDVSGFPISIPPGIQSLILGITCHAHSADDVAAHLTFFAHDTALVLPGGVVSYGNRFILVSMSAGKVWQSGGEPDYDYAAATAGRMVRCTAAPSFGFSGGAVNFHWLYWYLHIIGYLV